MRPIRPSDAAKQKLLTGTKRLVVDVPEDVFYRVHEDALRERRTLREYILAKLIPES
jgi:hypothetical protein